EHRLGEPRSDAAGGLEQLEHLPLVLVGEAVQRQGVLADDEAGVPSRGPADAQLAERGRGALDGHADAAHLDHRGVGGERGDRAADEGDHLLRPFDACRAAACWSRFCAGARQMWQMARASASAASAGRGGALSRSSRVTMAPTCAFSARPLPVTAALTSLGVCRATGMPRRAAHSVATALAWAVPMTVRTLCWLKTRSTATYSGRCSSSHCSRPSSRATRRRPRSASAGVRTTPTPSMVSGRPATPSTTPTPHRVSPGSTPSTRTLHLPWPSSVRAGYPLPPTTPGKATGRRGLVPSARGACRLPPAACRLPPAASVPRRPGGGYASTFSMISSLTSKLAKTFCTSSLSSSASISLKIFFAPSSSSSTCMVGTKLASADS